MSLLSALASQSKREPWREQAACRLTDPNVFFEGDPAEAKRICNDCPVKMDCLWAAIRSRQDGGVWGGATDDERQAIVKRWGSSGPDAAVAAIAVASTGR